MLSLNLWKVFRSCVIFSSISLPQGNIARFNQEKLSCKINKVKNRFWCCYLWQFSHASFANTQVCHLLFYIRYFSQKMRGFLANLSLMMLHYLFCEYKTSLQMDAETTLFLLKLCIERYSKVFSMLRTSPSFLYFELWCTGDQELIPQHEWRLLRRLGWKSAVFTSKSCYCCMKEKSV